MIEGSADRPEPNLTTDGGVVKSPKRVGQDEDTALVQDPDTALTREQRAALALDVAWLAWRTELAGA